MAPIRPAAEADQIRQQIIDAAEARFEHFGYRKTAMAEIADDVSMSAANLYRYFDNKQDIAVACATRCMADRTQHLKRVLLEGRGACEKLEIFVIETTRYTHELVAARPRINEVVEEITTHRPEVVQAKTEAVEGVLMEILALGNATGEFQVDDVADTARAVQAALVLFEVPIFVGMVSQAVFEQRARSLVRLLCAGLRAG